MNAMTKSMLKNPPQLIDCVRVEGVDGMLGITSCPGLRGEFIFDLYCEGLIDDLLTLRAWGADVVVTLLENAEIQALGVRDLGNYVETFNMLWVHLPVSTAGVLYELSSDQSRAAVQQLCALLRQGKRVVVHCKDGQGRAGLFSVRLLLGLGVSAEEAVRIIRKARPGCLPLLTHEKQCRSVEDEEQSFVQASAALSGK